MSKIKKKSIFNQCLYTMIQNFVDLQKLELVSKLFSPAVS